MCCHLCTAFTYAWLLPLAGFRPLFRWTESNVYFFVSVSAITFHSLPQSLPNLQGKLMGQIAWTSSILAKVGQQTWLPGQELGQTQFCLS